MPVDGKQRPLALPPPSLQQRQPKQQPSVTFVLPGPPVQSSLSSRCIGPKQQQRQLQPASACSSHTKRLVCRRDRHNETDRREELQCPICVDMLIVPVKTACGHVFCFFCLFHHDIVSCPLCRSPISVTGGDFALDAFADLSVDVYVDEAKRRRRWKQAVARFSRCVGPSASLIDPDHRHDAAGLPLRGDDGNKRWLRALAQRMISEVLASDKRHVPVNPAENLLLPEVPSVNPHELTVRARWVGVTGGHRRSDASVGDGDRSDVVVSEQCEMYFVNGFMRRRAPSLLLVTEQDDDGCDSDDGSDKGHRRGCRGAAASVPKLLGRPPQHPDNHNDRHPRGGAPFLPNAVLHSSSVASDEGPPQWRRQLAARVANHLQSKQRRQRLPVLVDFDSPDDGDQGQRDVHQDSSLVRFNPRIAPLVVALDAEHAGDDLLIVDDDGDSADDDCVSFPSHHRRVCVPPNRTHHRQQTHSLVLPPPSQRQQQRIMSADTRLQSDLRQQLKALSAAASQRQHQKKASTK